MDLKILHSADFHARERDIAECRKVLYHLCDHATAHTFDLIVIAGDLTDRNDVKFDSQTARLVIETVSRLSCSAPVAIVTGTKYHDGNIPELMESVRGKYPVYVSSYPEQIVLTHENRFVGVEQADRENGKVLLSMIPTPTKQFFNTNGSIEESDRAIGDAMTSIFASFGVTAGRLNLPHVPVGHWQVGGAYISETQQLVGRDIEISVEQILSARPSVACLGHIHYAQQIGTNPIFFSGSTDRKNFGEMEAKGFWVHAIPADEIGYNESEWVELPARKLVRSSRDCTKDDAPSPPESTESLIGNYSDEEIENAHVRVEIKVWQDQREQVDREQVKKALLERGAAQAEVRVMAIPRQNVRAEKVIKADMLRDKITARAEIVGDSVAESILDKCDALEAECREAILAQVKKTA